jgi:hypothetical protein
MLANIKFFNRNKILIKSKEEVNMNYKQNNFFRTKFFRLSSFLPSCNSFISIFVNVVSAQRKTFKLLKFVPIEILIESFVGTKFNRFSTPLEITKET